MSIFTCFVFFDFLPTTVGISNSYFPKEPKNSVYSSKNSDLTKKGI
jgi:hypothetical protein